MREPVSRTIKLRGLSFHYLDFGGEGLPPAIFLHGTGLHSRLWLPYGEALGDRFHAYALDQRGHGDSTKEAEDYNWSRLAEDFLEFTRVLGLARPFCVGHSMGGAVLILAEGMRPGTVGRAVLIDPIIMADAYYGDRFPNLESDPMAARTLRRRALWPSRAEMIESYRAREPFRSWRAEQLRLYVEYGTEVLADGQVRLKCTPEIEARTYFGGHAADPWPFVPNVEAPTLLLRGTEGDTYGMTRAREVVAAMPRAELIEIPGATHFLPMEVPETVIAHILRFAERTVDHAAQDGESILNPLPRKPRRNPSRGASGRDRTRDSAE